MKIIRSISAVFLAILVLVSSTNFMIGMHFCMGKVQNIAFAGKAETCKKEKALPPCHKHMKPECCDDEVVIHEDADFQASVQQLHVDAPAPINLGQPLVLIAEVIPTAAISTTPYYNYDPPLRSYDLTVSLQVFLI